MIHRVLLSSTALASLAVLAAACTGSDDGSGSDFELTSGLYEFTIASVTNDLCWAEANQVPPEGVAAIDLLVSATGAEFSATPSPYARFYLQPLFGAREGDDLIVLIGNGTLTVTSNCDVSVSTSGSGLVTADDVFELSLHADLQAISTGTSGQCSSVAGETWPGATIPFPTLSEPTNGTCSVSFSGTAVKPAE